MFKVSEATKAASPPLFAASTSNSLRPGRSFAFTSACVGDVPVGIGEDELAVEKDFRSVVAGDAQHGFFRPRRRPVRIPSSIARRLPASANCSRAISMFPPEADARRGQCRLRRRRCRIRCFRLVGSFCFSLSARLPFSTGTALAGSSALSKAAAFSSGSSLSSTSLICTFIAGPRWIETPAILPARASSCRSRAGRRSPGRRSCARDDFPGR